METVFDKLKDIRLPEEREASEYDINIMVAKGVRGDNGIAEDQYNGITDVSRILGLVTDNFQAMDSLAYINRYGKAAEAQQQQS
ncbi:hypothetical protein [Capybara microvirus Cap1_SP_76]|nr:hypothetical protein [Capybara microvirus Cap1_SP_76]